MRYASMTRHRATGGSSFRSKGMSSSRFVRSFLHEALFHFYKGFYNYIAGPQLDGRRPASLAQHHDVLREVLPGSVSHDATGESSHTNSINEVPISMKS